MELKFASPQIHRRVGRFGIELELLDEDDKCEQHRCDCEYCCYEADEDEPGSRVLDVIHALDRQGLLSDNERHEYHCDCECCDPFRGGDAGLYAPQADCTVGVELVSRVLDVYSDDDLDEVFLTAPPAIQTAMRDVRWEPTRYTSNGNHIHVGHHRDEPPRFRAETLHRAQGLIYAAFAEHHGAFTTLAQAGLGFLRSYNGSGPMKARECGGNGDYRASGWLRDRESTFEFRLWNTPADTSQTETSVALSVGMMRWGVITALNEGSEVAHPLGQDRHVEALSRDGFLDQLVQCLPAQFPHHDLTIQRVADAFGIAA